MLENPETPLRFLVNEAKEPSVYTNLVFSMTVRLGEAFEDEYPETPVGRRFPIAACSFEGAPAMYYVMGKDVTSDLATNRWVNTGIVAPIDSDVRLTVTVKRDGNDTLVRYEFDGAIYEAVFLTDGSIGNVAYKGEGQVSELSGAFRENWVPPPGKAIPELAQESVEAWAKANGVAVERFAETTTDSQGRTYYESCLLNLAPGEPLVALADITKADATSMDVIVKGPLSGVGSKVHYELTGDGEAKVSTNGSFDVTLGEGRRIFTVQAYVDDLAVGRPSKVGSQSVTVSATGCCLPVPWTNFRMGDAKVTDLVKTSGLKANDQIDVYDASAEKWTSCVYDGTEWEAANGAAIPTVRRGQAFRFLGSAGTLYLIGGADASVVVSTDVPPNAYSLVAKPDGTAFSLSNLCDTDRVLVMERMTGLPTASYGKFHGQWVKKVTDGPATEVTEIPANQGFFLKTSAGRVTW